MKASLLLSGLICTTLCSQAIPAQIPQRLEDCLPIPTLAQDVRQRRIAAEAEEPPQPHIKVVRLTFQGEPSLPREEQARIAGSLTMLTYANESDWLGELQERVRDAWQQRGYFKVNVTGPVVQSLPGTTQEQRLAVSMTVSAGRIFRLDKMTFVHGTQFSASELRAFFPMQDGDVFDTHMIQQGLENIRQAYGKRGFVNFTPVPKTDLDEPHGLINLGLDLDEGKQFRFGEIKVLGLDPQLAKELLRESGLVTGNIFDGSLIDKFFDRNRHILPADARPENDTERRYDENEGTVSIKMDFRGCPQIPSEDNPR
jgi:outer membrane protein assembly factor BamA